MAFPSSPINGQISVVNGIRYTYNSTLNAWFRTAPTSANVITTDTANIVSNTTSTSTTTGALRVAGGVGVVGNIYAGNFFYANGAAVSGAGAVGYTGSAGSGYTGSAGTAGTTGYTGSEGSAGSTGYTGSASTAAGYTGSTGTTGNIGYTGSAGTGGGSFTTGNTKPVSASVGAYWFDTDTDVLYQYMNVGTATHWIDVSGTAYNFGISQATQFAITTSTNLVSTMEYLAIAGGGGGSAQASIVGTGGGGAGGYLTGNFSITAGTTYVVTIGAGGASAPANTDEGYSGSNTTVGNTVVSYGGGRGGFWGTGGTGGSGGGSGGNAVGAKGVYPGSSYISAARQGYDGGVGSGTVGSGYASGGGGGGAGGAGGNSGSTSTQALGGIGLYNTITGANVYYASGGTGGIGTGSTTPVASRFAGNVNTGGGGAGGTYASGQQGGLAGGSGVVIFRYQDSFADAETVTGSPTFTNANGYKVYVFTSSGSIKI